MTSTQPPIIAVGVLLAGVLWTLTVWRPAVGCALLVLGIPLTGAWPGEAWCRCCA
ncbi:MAG: hypothetical protein M3256_02300 [Actinomycetota bacterium]|nr:hypothetical protein [Candidatus Dormibacteraeota bacterium]MDQ6945109.1 hypothetical protein [Actinomycetota bacterium]